MKISPARISAFDILLRIEKERAFSSVLLSLFESELSRADGSLCHELVLGTLRRQIYLDRVIDSLASGKKLDVEVRMALRLGLYQLFYLKVPAYSAINESVNLVKRAKKVSASGFANAVMRRASKGAPVLRYIDEIDRISVESSHPRWLIEKWISDHGAELAESLAMVNNEIPLSAFRFLAAPNEAERAVTAVFASSANIDNCYLTERITPPLRELAESGRIYFQDEASQMVAQAVPIPEGGSFLDVCAAPGGKTGLIANRHSGGKAVIVAGDLHMSRAGSLRENCLRQGVGDVSVVVYDAVSALPFSRDSFDTVLVDAPCSGTGTIRHNPEIRYFLVPDDLPALANKQLAILTNASKLVKAGGALIYSTCSIEPEENEAVCESFMAQNRGFRISAPQVPDTFLRADGSARTWPDRDKMDGFFIVAFSREN